MELISSVVPLQQLELMEEGQEVYINKNNNMKKKLIIGIIITLILGGGFYFAYSQGYLSSIFPYMAKDDYQYQSEELKQISEEAGINLEKGIVAQPKQEVVPVYEKQKEEELTNRNTPTYKGKLIINETNNKEWLVRVSIAAEADKKYGIWKQEGLTPIVFMEELKVSGYEEWEYKSTGIQELKGNFYIGVIGANNTIMDTLYTIQK